MHPICVHLIWICSNQEDTKSQSCFVLSELNIGFQELFPQRVDRGRRCGSRRFGTSSRSFLKSDTDHEGCRDLE